MHGAQHHLWMHAYSLQKCVWNHVYTYIYTHTHVHIYMYTCIHRHMYAYIHIHIHICMNIYIYTYAYLCTYTYMYIYIYAYAHMYIFISTTRACAPVQQCSSFFAMEAIANLSWVLREHRAGCRFRSPSCPFVEPAALLLASYRTLRNPSKYTLAHDAVATVSLHKHYLIIRVGAGLIRFVHSSHSRMAADLTLDKNLFLQPFSRVFPDFVQSWWATLFRAQRNAESKRVSLTCTPIQSNQNTEPIQMPAAKR